MKNESFCNLIKCPIIKRYYNNKGFFSCKNGNYLCLAAFEDRGGWNWPTKEECVYIRTNGKMQDLSFIKNPYFKREPIQIIAAFVKGTKNGQFL